MLGPKKTVATAFLCPIFISFGASSLSAQSEPFYAAKSIRLVIGYAPGGGYDTYVRTFARHFPNFVNGRPDVLVVNMPGAASLRAVQFLDAGAPKDGTVISIFNPGLITQSLTAPEKVKVRFTDFQWIGTMSRDVRVCYVWNPRIKETSLDALRRVERVVFGETGTGSAAYVEQRILGDIFGLRVHQVLGYPGSGEKRLAIERGELDGDCGAWTSIPADWLRDKKVTPLVRFTRDLAAGMDSKIPFALDLISDDGQRSVLSLLGAANDFGRPFIVSREVPPARVDVLRAAFSATVRSPAFLEDAQKQNLGIIGPMSGDEAEKALRAIYGVAPSVVARAKEISGD
jgi:tripartite-type tricarboxylate transporter receptor subunit TctC